MDTSPDVRVIDVLDQRLKQLGLIGRKSRSSSAGSQKSRNSSSSGISHSSFSDSSRSSSHSSRGLSRSNLKRKSNTHKKKVKFESQKLSKNGGPTTPPHQRRKGHGNRSRKRKVLSPHNHRVVGYICTLNKSFQLPVSMFSLRFLSPEILNHINFSNHGIC